MSEWVSLPWEAVFGHLAPSWGATSHFLLFTAQLRVEPGDTRSFSQPPSWTLSVLTCQQRLCPVTKTKDDKGCVCNKSNPVSHMPTPIYFSLNKIINTFPRCISIISHYKNGSLSCNYYSGIKIHGHEESLLIYPVWLLPVGKPPMWISNTVILRWTAFLQSLSL